MEKNKNSKDKEIIKILSNFINNDEFSEEIIEKILLNGIPESLPCLRPLIWKSLIGFFPLKQLSKWVDITNKNGTVIAVRCSCCGQSPKHAIRSDFCPRCGSYNKAEGIKG